MFELSERPWDDGMPDHRRAIATEPSLRLGGWRLTNQQELIVDFSGFVGVQLVLRRRPTDGMFYGRAKPTSDAALPPGAREGTVVARKEACDRPTTWEPPLRR
jgi:hypothetical protein